MCYMILSHLMTRLQFCESDTTVIRIGWGLSGLAAEIWELNLRESRKVPEKNRQTKADGIMQNETIYAIPG